jgi:cell wall-associated NlpC family hydrolase
VLIGATDFQDLVTRVDLMRRVGLSDAAIVAQVEVARADLDRSSRALEIRKNELTALRLQATTKREAVESALQAQASYLARMNATLKTLIAEERERQKRVAAEKAAALAAAKTIGQSTSGGRSLDPDALKGAHPDAVSVARRFVDRTPYLWGGTTPAGFDCSGLVQYCYREIGINLPRTSRQQYLVGSFIPANRLDLLQPGDLVFFGRDGDPGRIHHVGMYIGSGNMIHAPQTGELVTVASLVARIESRGDYVGACRP